MNEKDEKVEDTDRNSADNHAQDKEDEPIESEDSSSKDVEDTKEIGEGGDEKASGFEDSIFGEKEGGTDNVTRDKRSPANEDEKSSPSTVEDTNKEAKDDNDIEEIQNKQIKWAVILMAGIILLIIVVPFVKTNFVDKFEYKGLIFQKTQLGDLIFYSSRFPVLSITGNVIGNYAVNFRNDPRDLEDIPVNLRSDRIDFTLENKNKYGPVYISLDPRMEACEDSGIALLELSGFLRDSGLDVKSAVTDKNYAKENNLVQRWCHNSGFDTVIIITDGNETVINEIAPNCYEIVFNDCRILEGAERFILSVLEEYARRFEKS